VAENSHNRFPTEELHFRETPVKLLMQSRIEDILLVCSKYDKFMLEEDGRVDEQIFQEYVTLNLRYPPKFTQVSTAEGAISELARRSYDMVITMLNIGNVRSLELAEQIHEHHPHIPVVVLTPFSREVSARLSNEDLLDHYHIFAWLGDDSILLAVVKLIEDRMNVEADVKAAGVQTIILVEDSVRYYSSYLPVIYRALYQQARGLMEEGLNEWQQTMRMRCRPKILLATTFEEAVELYNTYRDNLLGVISDISYKRNGEVDQYAGLRLCDYIREDNPSLPILLQSSERKHRAEAERYHADFLFKHSKNLLTSLRRYIRLNYGFGDFLFRNPDSKEVIARASDLQDLQHKILDISDESFTYHVERNDFSKWLKARALLPLAEVFVERTLDDFENTEDARRYIHDTVSYFREYQSRGTIAEFNSQRFDESVTFSRIGDGSLGGKGRGLAFIDFTLKQNRMRHRFDGIVITIPKTVVLTTAVFEQFMEQNNLFERATADIPDAEILSQFMKASFPKSLHDDLAAMLRVITTPIAVRSSSLLEDSHYQPFAGVYSTFMLANNHDSLEKRVTDLTSAIKSVYASTYFRSSRDYMNATNNLIGEEKMAVVIQEVTGTVYPERCYPSISGVARSLNFYPIENERTEDGIVHLAIGLGRTVVEGGSSLRFSPRYPKKIIQLSDVDTALKSTQKRFYAVDMNAGDFAPTADEANTLVRPDVEVAEEDPSFSSLVSTYDFENNQLRDGLQSGWKRVVTFAGVLKYRMFPLAAILTDLLELAANEMNVPVEIEFAADLNPPAGLPKTFSFLQVRPIVEGLEAEDIEIDDSDLSDTIVYSDKALGNGVYKEIADFVYVKPEEFQAEHTKDISGVLTQLNERFMEEERDFVLAVPGRLGSTDPWLGVPIRWAQIARAKVIIEVGLESFRVDPSQGTHFFQNITTQHIGYLTVNPYLGDGVLDFSFLDEKKAQYEDAYVRHVRFDVPLDVRIAGRDRKGVVLKPGRGKR